MAGTQLQDVTNLLVVGKTVKTPQGIGDLHGGYTLVETPFNKGGKTARKLIRLVVAIKLMRLQAGIELRIFIQTIMQALRHQIITLAE